MKFGSDWVSSTSQLAVKLAAQASTGDLYRLAALLQSITIYSRDVVSAPLWRAPFSDTYSLRGTPSTRAIEHGSKSCVSPKFKDSLSRLFSRIKKSHRELFALGERLLCIDAI